MLQGSLGRHSRQGLELCMPLLCYMSSKNELGDSEVPDFEYMYIHGYCPGVEEKIARIANGIAWTWTRYIKIDIHGSAQAHGLESRIYGKVPHVGSMSQRKP